MSTDKAKKEAQSRNCKNSGELNCCLLPCPFCGGMPSRDSNGMVMCKNCFDRENSVATCDDASWNKRGPAEFTKDDIALIRTSVERWVDDISDDISDDIEMSNFTWEDKIRKKKDLGSLVTKIRLWYGR